MVELYHEISDYISEISWYNSREIVQGLPIWPQVFFGLPSYSSITFFQINKQQPSRNQSNEIRRSRHGGQVHADQKSDHRHSRCIRAQPKREETQLKSNGIKKRLVYPEATSHRLSDLASFFAMSCLQAAGVFVVMEPDVKPRNGPSHFYGFCQDIRGTIS